MSNRTTVRKQARFLDAISRGSTVVDAAEYAGVARSTVYAWAEGAQNFKARWEAAEAAIVRDLEQKAHEMALGGNVRLLMWLIERHGRPKDDGETVIEERVGTIEIVGLEDASDGPFIEFVENEGSPT